MRLYKTLALALTVLGFFLTSLSFMSAQNVSDEVFDVLLGKQVTLSKIDGTLLSGKLEKDKADKIVLINESGEVVVVLKKDIKQIKKDASAESGDKSEQKTIIIQQQPIPQEKKLTPEQTEQKSQLLQQYETKLRSANSLSRGGNALLIPGIIFDAVGAVALVFGYSGLMDTEDYHSGDYVSGYYTGYSYTSGYWTDSYYTKNTAVSDAFITTGWVCVGVGIPCTVIGIILKSSAGGKRREAENLRRQANAISYDLVPTFNPRNGSVGLAFSLTY